MANRTDTRATAVHGADPQSLLPALVRHKIYESLYWKERCFGLTAATLIDQALALTHVGGTFGEHSTPTPFLCLLCKLLAIGPERAIVEALLQQENNKYLRMLAVFYLRLTAQSADIYSLLEPLLADYRRVRTRNSGGQYVVRHCDEIVEVLLSEKTVFELPLPRITQREALVASGKLPARQSPIAPLLGEMIDDGDGGGTIERESESKERRASESRASVENQSMLGEATPLENSMDSTTGHIIECTSTTISRTIATESSPSTIQSVLQSHSTANASDNDTRAILDHASAHERVRRHGGEPRSPLNGMNLDAAVLSRESDDRDSRARERRHDNEVPQKRRRSYSRSPSRDRDRTRDRERRSRRSRDSDSDTDSGSEERRSRRHHSRHDDDRRYSHRNSRSRRRRSRSRSYSPSPSRSRRHRR